MAIYHIAYHGYRNKPSQEQFEAQVAMLNAAFAAAPHIEDGAAGRYQGHPADGFGVPPTFRTADQIGSDPERTRGIARKIHEIQAGVS